jgi:TRAP-type uncharacterized transport system substrate-binding protein
MLAKRLCISGQACFLRARRRAGRFEHSQRAEQGRGALTVVPAAGSDENVARLTQNGRRCANTFAIVQDGTPVPPNSGIEVLGRLPEPESLILLARRYRTFAGFADLRGAAIGIGPEQSGTAHLMRQLFEIGICARSMCGYLLSRSRNRQSS